MKNIYTVIMQKNKGSYYVDIPDFNTGTQGADLIEAMAMARDAIGILGIDAEDDGEPIPEPNTSVRALADDEFAVLIDVDFIQYRKDNDNKSVRKNCTIPYWLSVEADKVHINYSKVLQNALVKELEI